MISSLSTLGSFRISSICNESIEYPTELDSHADTCVVGKNVHIIRRHDRTVDVTGYDATHGTVRSMEIVDAE